MPGTQGVEPTRPRWVSPMMRRILSLNLVPLALLLATLLYLDQYQNGLLDAEVGVLREQARIYAGALSESAVRQTSPDHPELAPDLARPLLRRLTEPTPNAQARLYAPDGQLMADSRMRQGQGDMVQTEPLPPPVQRGWLPALVSTISEWMLRLVPHPSSSERLPPLPGAGFDWQPDVKQELTLSTSDQNREMPPYIRRTDDNRLLVTIAEPVQQDRHLLGIVQLTRDAREVDDSLLAIRTSILGLFSLALGLTVIMSWYLSRTIARPILQLAGAARAMREGKGRRGQIPSPILHRTDEVGELAISLRDSAIALWARMDAIERFAADVSHEIKNPLSSIRSAIETLRRIEDPKAQRRLLEIIADDVIRLDRLITDISDASRVDAELSRAQLHPVDVAAMLATLAEIHDATRNEDAPVVHVDVPAGAVLVPAVEDRLVQVLRNLIGNACSFSPPHGTITLRARETGSIVEIAVEDEGPGIPDGKLGHIFDRFYSERPSGEQFGKHSGLGLSISRQIIEALGGRIAAENRRDQEGTLLGARFVIRLPKAA